jgi:hypothetical protein
MMATKVEEKCLHVEYDYIYDSNKYPNNKKAILEKPSCPMWFPPEVDLHKLAETLCLATHVKRVTFDEEGGEWFAWKWTYDKNGFSKRKQQIVL